MFKLVLATVLAAPALSGAVLPSGTAADGRTATPGHQASEPGVLVVQANLNEALRPEDVADPAELDTFAATVAASAPRPPDALLLTEILGPGAQRVAAELSARTGGDYRVAVAPGSSPYLPDGGIRESAIVVNRDTLSTTESGFTRVHGEDQA